MFARPDLKDGFLTGKRKREDMISLTELCRPVIARMIGIELAGAGEWFHSGDANSPLDDWRGAADRLRSVVNLIDEMAGPAPDPFAEDGNTFEDPFDDGEGTDEDDRDANGETRGAFRLRHGYPAEQDGDSPMTSLCRQCRRWWNSHDEADGVCLPCRIEGEQAERQPVPTGGSSAV
jgi:hypothetical protein